MKDKTLIYYTCNEHDQEIDDLARGYLSKIDLPIISVSLNKEIDFGDVRIVMEGERSPLTMHKQILKGLEACTTKYACLIESDVFYHPSHFDFTPERDDTYYFNVNVWKRRWPEQFYTRTDSSQQMSGIIASTKLLTDFIRARVEEIEKNGFDRHYEPKGPRENYSSAVANICIRHDKNITRSKWSVNDYRDKEYAKGWTEATSVPGWT